MDHSTHATAAGIGAPENDEAPIARTIQGPQERTHRDSAPRPNDLQELIDEKRWATLQARSALAGLTLTRDEERVTFTVSRWGFVKELPSITQVEAFLDRVGGRGR